MEAEARLIAAVRTASRKLSDTGDFDALLKEVLAICVEAVGASGGTIYLHDQTRQVLTFQHVLPESVEPHLGEKDMPDDFGMAGAAFQSQRTVCREFPPKADKDRNPFEKATGIVLRNLLATPLLMKEDVPIGVVQLLNKIDGAFDGNDVAIIETIASVATLAYVNRRLVMESARASTLLGMGKVSHDIGNLAASLHATINYSEMAHDGLREHLNGSELDPLAENFILMQAGMFVELRQSVDRIVGYSRLISDMSAGRALRPVRAIGELAPAVLRAASYLESDARAKGIELLYDVQDAAPPYSFDDLFVFRIVQNLVGNAIKAVAEVENAEGGTVIVRYRFAETPAGHLIEVRDTGPGMTEETARRILIGEATSQWNRASGSGWGLRIVKELAASHDGELEIDSKLGDGSTFRVRMAALAGLARQADAASSGQTRTGVKPALAAISSTTVENGASRPLRIHPSGTLEPDVTK